MVRGKTRSIAILCLVLAIAAPAFSQNQSTGAITGRAQDSSGALIPGVEVSIISPSMIGGARSAVTDEQGSYRFTLLAPGTYRVSFALSGFKTINIDGNEVLTGKTLTVNGGMQVASVAEEVTVTSVAPTIDLEAATVGVNWSQQKLDNLPYSRSLAGLTTMIPGLFQTSYDVGGSNFATGSGVSARSYGRSGNAVVAIDGLVWDQGYEDFGAFEEVNISTASKGADQMNAGVTLSMVIKSGSNQFHGAAAGELEKGGFQSTNVDDALLKRGYAPGSNKFTTLKDLYGEIGGPVMKDKLWFYFTYRRGTSGNFIPGFIRLSDGQQQEFFSQLESPTAKLTYQLTQNQKLDASWQLGRKWQPYRSAGKYVPLEGSQNQDSWSTFGPSLKWTDIISPRMTATAGINRGGYWWPDFPWTKGCTITASASCIDGLVPGVDNKVRRTDTTTSSSIGPILSIYRRPIRWTWNADVSYFNNIGGKNSELKFGYYGWWDKSYNTNFGYPNQQIYRYTSLASENFTESTPEAILGLYKHPNSVQILSYPNSTASGGKYTSFYINDKITWNRKLTITAGFRFDRFTSFLPAQGDKGENPFFTTVNKYPARTDSPVYIKVVPRVSFAYDLTGAGRLALKGSFGRYTDSSSSPGSLPGPGLSDINPNSTTTCTYNNWNGVIPFIPTVGADGKLFTADDGGGATWNACTGGATGTRRLGTNLKADYLDEYTAGLDIGFNRDYSLRMNVVRKFSFVGAKSYDLAQPIAAYTDRVQITDPGMDGKTGTTDDAVAYVWSVPLSYPTRGQVDTIQNNVRKGEGKDQYTAYEFTLNKQMSHKWSMLASYATSFRHENANDPTNPNDLFYQFNNPVWEQAIKLNGSYDLPWGFLWSGTFSAQSGSYFNRTVQIRNAAGTNVTQTVASQVGRYPFVNLWDNRISKKFRIGEKQSIEGIFDLFNTMNINTVTAQNVLSTGGTYNNVTSIVSPRIFKLTARYKF